MSDQNEQKNVSELVKEESNIEEEILSRDKEKDYDAFKVIFEAHTESTSYTLKAHPRAQGHLQLLSDCLLGLVKDYIFDGKIPKINKISNEEIENSIAPELKVEKDMYRKRPEA